MAAQAVIPVLCVAVCVWCLLSGAAGVQLPTHRAWTQDELFRVYGPVVGTEVQGRHIPACPATRPATVAELAWLLVGSREEASCQAEAFITAQNRALIPGSWRPLHKPTGFQVQLAVFECPGPSVMAYARSVREIAPESP